MRDNLLFHGIPECTSNDQRKEEDCEKKIKDLCESVLNVEDAQSIKFDHAHRLGPYKTPENKTNYC